MIGRAGRWALDGLVLFFALYAFMFVPLGRATAFDHVRAILDTNAAKNAGRELLIAGARLREKLFGEVAIEARGRPTVPDLPRGAPVQMRVVSEPAKDGGADASLSY